MLGSLSYLKRLKKKLPAWLISIFWIKFVVLPISGFKFSQLNSADTTIGFNELLFTKRANGTAKPTHETLLILVLLTLPANAYLTDEEIGKMTLHEFLEVIVSGNSEK